MKISVIIPNYNGEELLKKNLPSVLDIAKEYSDIELIIADDFSSDNSISVINELIQKYLSKVNIKLITSDKNKGFSSNVNRAVGEASGEIIVLLNTDVIPSRRFLDPLLKHFKDEKVFAVGCMDESLEDGKIILRGRGVGRWEKGLLVHSAGDLNKQNTLWVSGGSGAFRRDLWNKLGGFDKIYNPFYWEDIDLSYRAQKSGFKTLFEKNSIVRHEHDNGIIKKKYNQGKIRRVAYRNQFIFAWKNSDFNNLLKNFLWVPYHLISALFRGDYLMIQAFFAALILLPNIVRFRITFRKRFKLTDKEVIGNLV